MPCAYRMRGIAMSDWIRLYDLRYQSSHGVLPHEHAMGQPFQVDVEIGLDIREAARRDRLEDSVNYAEVVNRVSDIMEGESVNLIETLAEKIAQAVLSIPHADEVKVRVKKMAPPVEHTMGYVEVEIWRHA